MALLWFSFPPIGVSWLAWFALLPLVCITVTERRFERRHYWQLWLAGLLYWLATFYFIPIPHPVLWLGWIVISVYLAFYLPFFVLGSRVLHNTFRIPNILAVPICWTAMEWIRAHLFTGMGLAFLSHTQFRQPVWIQVSDLFGAYTLSFVIVLAAAGMYRSLRVREGKYAAALVNVGLAIAVVAGTFFYGQHKLAQTHESNASLQVGLIQGSIDTVFPSTKEQAIEFRDSIVNEYENLTIEALREWEQVDLIVWPENGWQFPDLHPDTDTQSMHEEDVYLYREGPQVAWARLFVAGKTMPTLLVGAVTVDPVLEEQYGAVISMDKDGQVQERYYKNHLVMFGEYVPLADVFPLLQRIPAIGKGLETGDGSVVVTVKGVRLAPNICFETTVPHFIRNQVNELADSNNEPDIIVNITNDGWFYGTSCLDFHLACNVFRAVEMRKPLLACANTGLSAHINPNGEVLREGPRRRREKILATVNVTNLESLYRTVGDWVAIAFAILSVLACLMGLFGNRLNNPRS